MEGLAAKGARDFLLSDVIADRRDDCRKIFHGDGLRRDLLELFVIRVRGFLFAALAFVLHEGLEAAEPLRSFFTERLLAEDAMGAGPGYWKRMVGIGGGARIVPGSLPKGLPDVRADVGQRLIGEQVGGGGRGGGARCGKVRASCAQSCPAFLRRGGN